VTWPPGNISGRAGADPGILVILSVLVVQLVGRLGINGFWDRDYGWGPRVRVGRPFQVSALARRRPGPRSSASASVRPRPRYRDRDGTRLGDLKENWFILCKVFRVQLNTQANTHLSSEFNRPQKRTTNKSTGLISKVYEICQMKGSSSSPGQISYNFA
jgi:hypothetical protein